MIKNLSLASVVVLLLSGGLSHAAVTADEAAKLKSTLTPLGAEKAGNKDGSIPAWNGGLTTPGSRTSNLPADPFPGEKPLFQITAKNMGQYADKLGEGVKALLTRYPSYRIDVYPAHRTAAAPQYVYDNTFRNATSATLEKGGLAIKGAYGGIPFPIPKTGIELYWNHTLRVKPSSVEFGFVNWVGSADGRRTMANRADNNNQMPYYLPDGSAQSWNGDYLLARFVSTEPSFKAGESLVVRDRADPDDARQAWQYLVGQRRVRRAPTVGYDTPDFVASGANYFDEVNGFWGGPDRYEWKLVGKKEMFIPYNNNRYFNTPADEAFVPYHTNPDKTRWELHRVWVVEATLTPGKRHVVPRRTFYFDEDTWAITMIDGYDADGKLWRTSQSFSIAAPEVPAINSDPTIVYNLQAGTYSVIQFLNGEYWRAVPPKPNAFFTGDSLASQGVR
ncbi:hypothetical protein M2352_004925 [Azospirillum fermentarium]|uniref:DUF1329 domain-containing protein n=1 Tax=Azospirillum fermentarium TaxID=1233114 RepID=UPI002225BD41|nr:DUF1329 domain-containing protein [Azospirillum fermentarium]MCW2249265.1 hypothetical protein [Azospirillum fermentarium]